MPGLKILEKFRRELSDLGHERQVTAEWGEVYEELPLPEEYAASAPSIDVDNLLASLGETETPDQAGTGPKTDFASSTAPGSFPDISDLGDLSSFGFPQDAEPAESASDEQSDSLETFTDFLSSMPIGESSPEPFAETPAEEDFAVPDELLSGFASDIEEAAAVDSVADFEDGLSVLDVPDEEELLQETGGSPDDLAAPDSFAVPDAFSALDSFAMPDSFAEPDSFSAPDSFAMPDAFSAPDFAEPPEDVESVEEILDLGGEEPSPAAPVDAIEGLDALLAAGLPSEEILDDGPGEVQDFSAPEPGEMDFTPSFEDGARKPQASDDFLFVPSAGSSGGFSDSTGSDGSGSSSASAFGDAFSDFTIPADLEVGESADESADAGDLDGFDGFSLDEDFLKKSIEEAIPGTDEFNIPGFSDFTSAPARVSLSELPAAVSAKKSAKKEIPMEISESDFQKFLEELSYFPLNLRIAIEEFLSGAAGSELQKMELVHHVITGHPVKKIARSLEHYLDRPIPIPRDYERKTAEDYEREKSSLRYIFFNKILPVAILASIITVLAACTAYLSWQFIYRPIAAENRYKRGYAALQDERYSQSIDLFDEAVRIWEKKNWYFTYARGYKDKKQYISAEMMYERILNRYRNDKEAGLEYAEMLRTDLRNFEKAETILKRRLLDFHVNDADGLLLLGDTYLDWAEEEPGKYENALATYSRLVELYGQKDPYLARLMRYFIRTDNLKEVLPLKEHFTDKRAKIGASDLVELGGYLLEKRYSPKPGDNEYLRSQIEDVRSLLERAVKADKSSPEAHYNMGRFFIYNYNNDAASASLQNALAAFKNARTMSPVRALSHVDTYRLLGEMHADEKEYLKAQGMYLDGMALYEDLRANRAVKRSQKVGQLYADFADIDYFISNDLDSAYANYSKAVEELNGTPSVRYRIGYIQYQKQDFERAMETFNIVHAEMPDDKNLMFSYANTLFRRENYYAAQAYYERLQEMLEAERIRKGILFPQVREDHGSFVEDYMRNANNLGVALERLSSRTGDSQKNARALALFAESNRAWDALTRNQQTMVRAQGSNLAYLNMQNMTHPRPDFNPEIYSSIAKTLENETVLQQRTDE